MTRRNVPVNIAAILAARRKVGVKFNSSKGTLLALDRSDEAHYTLHVARDVDSVAHGDIVERGLSGCCGSHVDARARAVAQNRVVAVALADIGDAGEGALGESGKGCFAREGSGGRGQARLGCVGRVEVRC